MKGLILRSISGIGYVAVILAGLLCGKAVFVVFLEVLALLALIEFYGLANQHRERRITLGVDLLGALVGVTALCELAGVAPGHPWLMACVYLIYLIVRLVMQLYTRESHPLENLAYSFMGQLYIALPIGLLAFVYEVANGPALLLAMSIMIWLNDTGAFCVGSLIGRHKMFPRISPKKSWEGLIGGVVFAVCSAFLFKYCFSAHYTMITIEQMLVMGALVSVFATWGDLVESLIKRTLGVKDSGHMIPGHGGILDRIDSLLLVSLAMALFTMILAPVSQG